MDRRLWASALLAIVPVVACGPAQTTSSAVATSARQTVPSGYPTTDNFLTGVSCPNPTDCIAVGHAARAFDDGGPLTRTLVEENSGAGWRVVPSPNDDASVGSALIGVTCSNAGHCLAVGESYSRASLPQPLIEENAGSGWAIVPGPDLSARGGNGSLVGTACPTPTDCIAVGDSSSEGVNLRTLIEENTGLGWHVVPSPDPSQEGDDRLNAVACASPTFCVAVGLHRFGNDDLPLIEQNSGSGWTIVAARGSGGLEGVSCPSTSVCAATGGEKSVSGTLPNFKSLVEDMINGAWAAVTVPGLVGVPLGSVACSSSTYCMAVTWHVSAGGSPVIAERINGVWAVGRSTPPVANNVASLEGVACLHADECIAVGEQVLGSEADYLRPTATFIAQHTAHAWTVQASPNV